MTTPPLIVDIMMSRFGCEYELCHVVARVEAAPDVLAAIRVLEETVPELVGAADATFVSGDREGAQLGRVLVQPIGNSAALYVRRAPHQPAFGAVEAAKLAAVASAAAPAIERLLP